MLKKCKFNVGLTLLVQSASFVILFFMLYNKKKSLANTFLALSAIGGIAGAYLVLKEAKNEVEACEQAAKDACEEDSSDDDDSFDFNECESLFGDCSECSEDDAENTCEITVEDDEEAEPVEEVEEIPTAEVAEEALEEEVVAEEPAEDIFTEAAPQA